MIGSRKTKLVYGKGRLYFEPFADDANGIASGLGEIYIGNTPGFAITLDQTLIERYISMTDQRDRREPEVIEETHAGKFTTDDITTDNLALWFGNQAASKDPTPPTSGNAAYTTTLVTGRFHQVGAGMIVDPNSAFNALPSSPIGFKGLLSLELRNPTTAEVIPSGEGTPYQLDLKQGRVYVTEDGATGSYRIVFTVGGSIVDRVSPSPKKLHGSLRYISDNPNPGATQVVFYYPWVRLSATSTFDLKRPSDFLELNYEFTAYRKPGQEFMYVETNTTAGLTPDQWAIIQEGLTFDEFIALEDQLDQIINVIMPSRGYPVR